MKEYFSHDLKARNDRKMVNLQMQLGMEGVGLYWCIVEMLYEEQGKIMLSDCERIAFELRVESDLVKSIISDFDLFDFDDFSFWSASVNKRIDAQIQVSNGAKKAAQTRWQKFENQKVTDDDATAMQTHTDSNANKVKKSKEKESKINNTIVLSDKSQTEKIERFYDEIQSIGNDKYNAVLLHEFYNYWSERNQKGKMRWELEKTFEIPNRLATWQRNSVKGFGSTTKTNTAAVAKDNFNKAMDIIYNGEQ